MSSASAYLGTIGQRSRVSARWSARRAADIARLMPGDGDARRAIVMLAMGSQVGNLNIRTKAPSANSSNRAIQRVEHTGSVRASVRRPADMLITYRRSGQPWRS